MPFRKWIGRKVIGERSNERSGDILALITGKKEEQSERETIVRDERPCGEDITLIYLANDLPLENVLNILQSMNENGVKVFTSEEELIDYTSCMSDKTMFLVIDSEPNSSLLAALESLEQVDSLFVYSSTLNNSSERNSSSNSRVVIRCNNDEALVNAIRESCEGLEKQIGLNLYNEKEKAKGDLSKEVGSFLFFQLLKNVLVDMPKTDESKQIMITKCRVYYQGNIEELNNIQEFDLTYKSTEAIQWYMKKSFVYKFVNKGLRTKDVEMLYYFRFYIIDLCEQLKMKFFQLQRSQKGVLKLYRGLKLSHSEITTLEENVGNLISTNGYLSTSRFRPVAYRFAKKVFHREGLVSALFEYHVDLTQVKKIIIGDITEYSDFPEEGEVLIDIGASFRINSCTFDAKDNLWHVVVQATDQGAALASKYIEYQKKKMDDGNIVPMFGYLLVEMGEYGKADKYFDTVLASNPNDEEISCIYFNFGRTYRVKGDFDRARDYYQRAYNLHEKAKPKRLASAAKALNSLGVISSEQGDEQNAIEYYEKALQFLHKSVPPNHIDIAGTLTNLSSIYCEQQEYDIALENSLKAMEIYKDSLPAAHPNNALAQVVLANIYLAKGDYQSALLQYHQAMTLLTTALPSDHLDIARTKHNIGLAYEHQGNLQKATEYFDQAKHIAEKTLSKEHSLIHLINNSRQRISAIIQSFDIIRL